MLRNIKVSICMFFLVFSLLPALNLHVSYLYAESDIISKSIRLIKGRESTEFIKTKNKSGESIANAKITVTVEDPSVLTIRVKDVADGDQVNSDENVLVVKSGMEGKRAFAIKGLRDGSTTINFAILPEGADESSVVKQVLAVKVIELAVDVPKQW